MILRLSDWSTILVYRSAHALSIGVCARRKKYRSCRATRNIGLSSLAGGNDFGLLVAHGIVFYLFV